MSSSSKVVSSKVMDMELPGLTFHEMCWSPVKSHGESPRIPENPGLVPLISQSRSFRPVRHQL